MQYLRLTALACVGMALVGCGHPRIVNGLSSTDTQIKFLYKQEKTFGSPVVGVVKCKLGANSEISDCADLPIEYQD